MEIRKSLQDKPIFSVGIAVVLLLAAGLIIAREYWPERKADVTRAYMTDDDGKTWYLDSSYSVPPLDHNGKTAVFAEIFTYDGGNKQFCAYLEKYNPDAKKELEASIAEAQHDGLPPQSAKLFQDPGFLQRALLVKLPGANNPWLAESDPAAAGVMSVHSPDGTTVDNAFVY